MFSGLSGRTPSLNGITSTIWFKYSVLPEPERPVITVTVAMNHQSVNELVKQCLEGQVFTFDSAAKPPSSKLPPIGEVFLVLGCSLLSGSFASGGSGGVQSDQMNFASVE